MVSTENIRELVEPVLASIGLELWDVEVARDMVRIMVERSDDGAGPAAPDGLMAPADRRRRTVGPGRTVGPRRTVGPTQSRTGVDLDALSDASSVISPVLDAHPEAVPAGRYQLEVSSPGIERTLRTPEQYRRYIGTEVAVKTSEPVDGARRHRGRIVEVGPAGIDLEPDAAARRTPPASLRPDRPGPHRHGVGARRRAPDPGRPAAGRARARP